MNGTLTITFPSPLAGEGQGERGSAMNTPKTRFAKTLRQNMTDAEHCLWKQLRAHRLINAKFKRQQPIGPYIVDFVCFDARLVIEIDGGQHLDSDTDRVRDAWLNEHDFRVLRFWNNEVLKETTAVLEKIAEYLPPLPNPSPSRGEGLKDEDERPA